MSESDGSNGPHDAVPETESTSQGQKRAFNATGASGIPMDISEVFNGHVAVNGSPWILNGKSPDVTAKKIGVAAENPEFETPAECFDAIQQFLDSISGSCRELSLYRHRKLLENNENYMEDLNAFYSVVRDAADILLSVVSSAKNLTKILSDDFLDSETITPTFELNGTMKLGDKSTPEHAVSSGNKYYANGLEFESASEEHPLISNEDMVVFGENLMEAARSGDIDTMKQMLEQGAHVNFVDPSSKFTALMRACLSGHLDAVRFLIENGANPASISSSGDTALHYAARSGFAETVKILLKHGADSECKNEQMFTPRDVSAKFPEVQKLLNPPKKHVNGDVPETPEKYQVIPAVHDPFSTKSPVRSYTKSLINKTKTVSSTEADLSVFESTSNDLSCESTSAKASKPRGRALGSRVARPGKADLSRNSKSTQESEELTTSKADDSKQNGTAVLVGASTKKKIRNLLDSADEEELESRQSDYDRIELEEKKKQPKLSEKKLPKTVDMKKDIEQSEEEEPVTSGKGRKAFRNQKDSAIKKGTIKRKDGEEKTTGKPPAAKVTKKNREAEDSEESDEEVISFKKHSGSKKLNYGKKKNESDDEEEKKELKSSSKTASKKQTEECGLDQEVISAKKTSVHKKLTSGKKKGESEDKDEEKGRSTSFGKKAKNQTTEDVSEPDVVSAKKSNGHKKSVSSKKKDESEEGEDQQKSSSKKMSKNKQKRNSEPDEVFTKKTIGTKKSSDKSESEDEGTVKSTKPGKRAAKKEANEEEAFMAEMLAKKCSMPKKRATTNRPGKKIDEAPSSSVDSNVGTSLHKKQPVRASDGEEAMNEKKVEIKCGRGTKRPAAPTNGEEVEEKQALAKGKRKTVGNEEERHSLVKSEVLPRIDEAVAVCGKRSLAGSMADSPRKSKKIIGDSKPNSSSNNEDKRDLLIYAASSVDEKERLGFAEQCKRLEWTFTAEFDPDATHLVVSADGGRTKRTVNLLLGMLRGCWIVDKKWLELCIQKTALIPEKKYEIVALSNNGAKNGPERARMNHSRNGAIKLFAGLNFFLKGEMKKLKVVDLQRLIEAGGGTIVESEPKKRSIVKAEEPFPHADPKNAVAFCRYFIVTEPDEQKDKNGLPQPLLDNGCATVNSIWILDSIERFNLVDV